LYALNNLLLLAAMLVHVLTVCGFRLSVKIKSFHIYTCLQLATESQKSLVGRMHWRSL